MPVVTKSMEIKAPVAKVFEVVTNPDNWTKFVSNLVEVSDKSADLPAKGSTFAWKYRMMGFNFGGTGTVTDNQQGESFAMAFESKFPIKESYVFKDAGDGATVLEVTIDYEMPSPMKALFGDSSVMEKINETESQGVLEKIRALCENQ